MQNMFPFRQRRRSERPSGETRRDTYPSIDRRQCERRPTFCFVEIYAEDGHSPIEATMRNVSVYGAQLRLTSATQLPERLFIRSASERSTYSATLRWMSGVSIGVSFEREVKITDNYSEAFERIRSAESDLPGGDKS